MLAVLRFRLPLPVPVVLPLWHSQLAAVGPVEVVGALLLSLLGRLREIFGVVVVHVCCDVFLEFVPWHGQVCIRLRLGRLLSLYEEF